MTEIFKKTLHFLGFGVIGDSFHFKSKNEIPVTYACKYCNRYVMVDNIGVTRHLDSEYRIEHTTKYVTDLVSKNKILFEMKKYISDDKLKSLDYLEEYFTNYYVYGKKEALHDLREYIKRDICKLIDDNISKKHH